jgi:hypothetical protein
MYKPNGEELMSPLEEMAARAKMAEKKKTSRNTSRSIDSLRSALYSALYGSHASDGRGALEDCDRIYARNTR